METLIQYLKDNFHPTVGLLILAILVSIVVVVGFFTLVVLVQAHIAAINRESGADAKPHTNWGEPEDPQVEDLPPTLYMLAKKFREQFYIGAGFIDALVFCISLVVTPLIWYVLLLFILLAFLFLPRDLRKKWGKAVKVWGFE